MIQKLDLEDKESDKKIAKMFEENMLYVHFGGGQDLRNSSFRFKKLEESGIKTHYIKTIQDNHMVCKKVDIIPLEVIVRNLAAGSIVRQTTIPEGKLFYIPLVEFHLKDDSKDDPLLTYDRMKLMVYDQAEFIKPALDINKILTK